MNSQVLFPHIGKVIASTGSRRFPRMLHDLILTQLAVDATHITQLRVDQAVDGHGHNAVHNHHPLHGLPANDDPLLCATFPEQGSDASPMPQRRHGDANPVQLHLTGHKDSYQYVVSVYRSNQARSFSAQERTLLEDFSPLLLPMVEKHISALQPRGADTAQDGSVEGLETLRLRFADRLARSGLSLSNREMEVCVGLLAGRTAPQLAEQCQLKVNTVESYLKRAAIKLGISGRHSLLRWMYSPQESVAATASSKPE
ncbi:MULTISPECIES: LuxR C-terminal-related transcriptional regulator [Pseudomonas]|uniref:LuxR C-terminal-related transcriptional regulator n=1 Tax=Pseudomonas sessilinigenes TaxID=658629 RepID=I0CEV1_9PSED|nr:MULTISPECIES: LuxR C-terminal-related transcriptional regulator [Pseudomonas]AFH75333.1 LuxR family transcriptional regulator [Pseudomonas sessilinigenes]AZC23862.1 Transcriptional regulator, LuxR family [Pseudomonas sessilinigenes]QIH08988.1 helix-turn-helix transcriptional regulator [Pseudomonas sp. BIOMIG1BAC]QXH42840.1 LuxR C-terminal-related transcriptional regulator [Pseudomonas sessilinigenes]UMZ14132.1 helix-turn-helix transcriptional regulator [Pseudomonas sp. MPFS]